MSQQDNLVTVRAMMRRLWQLYDSGGHSGRSIRAQLLEAALPQPEGLSSIVITRRTLRKVRRTINGDGGGFISLFSTRLEFMNIEMFFCLVIRAVQQTQNGHDASFTEQKIISCALILLQAKRRLEQFYYCGGETFTAKQLIAEGRRRREQK
jgi:hypothetical protein